MVKGRWAQGLEPRFFTWIIRDRLAISERPGGFARNHRRVRRQEELIWLDLHGFTRVVSLLESSHNLHAYNEAKLHFEHVPLSRPDEYPERLGAVYLQLDRFVSDSKHKILVHHEEFGDRILGLMGGYLLYAGLASSGPEAIQIIETITSRELQSEGREIISITVNNRLMRDGVKSKFDQRESKAETQRSARLEIVKRQQRAAEKRAQDEAARKRQATLAAAEIARVAFVAEKKKAAELKKIVMKRRAEEAKRQAIRDAAEAKKQAARDAAEAKKVAALKAAEDKKIAAAKVAEKKKAEAVKAKEAAKAAAEKKKLLAKKEAERKRVVAQRLREKKQKDAERKRAAVLKAKDKKAALAAKKAKAKKKPVAKKVIKKPAKKSVVRKPAKKPAAKKSSAKKTVAKKKPAPKQKAVAKKAPAKKSAKKPTRAKAKSRR